MLLLSWACFPKSGLFVSLLVLLMSLGKDSTVVIETPRDKCLFISVKELDSVSNNFKLSGYEDRYLGHFYTNLLTCDTDFLYIHVMSLLKSLLFIFVCNVNFIRKDFNKI